MRGWLHCLRRACACSLLLALTAQAQDDADASALMLADQTAAPVAQASNWHSFVEAAAGQSLARNDVSQGVQRLSLDSRYDGAVAPGWRLLLADRLDANTPPQNPGDNAINTLKEAYLSWQVDDSRLLDVGRINQRNGDAVGYNPTDYFKTAALRSVVSVDPQSLKENRQGSVMLRGQQIWSGGSLTGLLSPRLESQADNGAYALDLGATNSSNRGLLVFSPQWSETLSPQFLLFQQDQAPPQLGVNVAGLLNDATVLHFEWSGGDSPSQISQALAQQGLAHADDSAFRSRWVLGVGYSTDNKITVDAELECNGLGLGKSDWNQLRNANPLRYAVYQGWVQTQQELPTQQSAFLHVTWQDAFISRLDLSAMQRYDLVDDSSMVWLEARYRLPGNSEVALQWQGNQGSSLSDYGVLPVQQNWLLVLRGYF